MFAPLPTATGLLATKGTGPGRQCARWPGHAISAEEHEQVYRSQLHLTLELFERASDGGMIPIEAKAQQDAVRSTLQTRLEMHSTAHSTPSLADLCKHRVETGQPQQPWTPMALPMARADPSLPSYGDQPNHAPRSRPASAASSPSRTPSCSTPAIALAGAALHEPWEGNRHSHPHKHLGPQFIELCVRHAPLATRG